METLRTSSSVSAWTAANRAPALGMSVSACALTCVCGAVSHISLTSGRRSTETSARRSYLLVGELQRGSGGRLLGTPDHHLSAISVNAPTDRPSAVDGRGHCRSRRTRRSTRYSSRASELRARLSRRRSRRRCGGWWAIAEAARPSRSRSTGRELVLAGQRRLDWGEMTGIIVSAALLIGSALLMLLFAMRS